MFNAIRNLVFVVCLALLAAVGALFTLYGSIEPCRMLASEMGRDTIRDVSEAFGTTEESLEMWDETAEQTFRLITSQYTSGQCFDQLTQVWWRKFTD
jgi:hypothetical protein